MASDGDTLPTHGIANPRLWRLGMLLDLPAATLTVAARSTVGDDEAICRRISLAGDRTPLRALEDAVYDNPLLLADFERTTVVLRTPRFAILPEGLASSPEACDDAASLLWTDPDFSPALMAETAGASQAAVLTACDADVAAFLGRTFAEASIRHVLSVELQYFAAKAPGSGNAPKLFAIVEPGSIDLLCFDGTRLLGATSYACTDAADMTYYAAATARVCGVAGPELHFYVAGDPSLRDSVASGLRRFAPRVMPWILPPAPATGDTPMPFTLTILPLCG